MPLYAIEGASPTFEDEGSVWIAPDASVVGRIHIGRNVGIWFGCALRGDNEQITIGDNSNVQEHTVFHTDPGFPLTIGTGCTIGHRALLHGCTIGDGSLVGMGAIVLNGARIGRNCLVGAGALVTEGKEFPDGSLIIGSPAKVARGLDEADTERLGRTAQHYVALARRFAASLHPV